MTINANAFQESPHHAFVESPHHARDAGEDPSTGCEYRPLGLNPDWKWRVMPGPDTAIEILSGSVLHQNGSARFPNTALCGGWAHGVSGDIWRDGHGRPPGGLRFPAGHRITTRFALTNLAGGYSGAIFPWLTAMPHHTVGSSAAAGFRYPAVSAPPIPVSRTWLFSEPVSLVFPYSRWAHSRGPLHEEHCQYNWEGIDQAAPWAPDVRTDMQAYVGFDAWLEHNQQTEKLVLHLEVAVVLLVGRQMDFQWSMPLLAQPASGIACGAVVAGTSGPCFGLPSQWGDLGSLLPECYCTCKGFNFQHCRAMDISANNRCLTNCNDPPYTDYCAACKDGHPDFMGEVTLHGYEHKELESAITWVHGDDYSQWPNVQHVFGMSLDPAEWVLSEFAAMQWPVIANTVDDNAANWYEYAPRFHAKVSGSNIGVSGLEVTGGRIDGPELPTIGNCLAEVGGAIVIPEVAIVDAEGWWEWLRHEHYYLTEGFEDYYCAGAPYHNTMNFNRLVELLQDDGIPLSTLGGQAEAVANMYMCRMGRSFKLMEDWLGNFTANDWRLMTRETNLQLRTDLYPGGVTTDGWYVFGIPGPVQSSCSPPYEPPSQCRSMLAWSQDGSDCVFPVEPPFFTCDWTYMFFAPTYFLPPSWPAIGSAASLDPYDCLGGQHCWTEVNRGGLLPKCYILDVVPPDPASGAPDPATEWHCDNFLGAAHATHGSWPRLQRWGRPYYNVQLRFTGEGLLEARAQAELAFVREETCYLHTEDDVAIAPLPDLSPGQGGPGPPLVTFMGKVAISRGDRFVLPTDAWMAGATCPDCTDDGKIPMRLKTPAYSIPKLLCGCYNDGQPLGLTMEFVGDGNTLRVTL